MTVPKPAAALAGINHASTSGTELAIGNLLCLGAPAYALTVILFTLLLLWK